MAPRPLTAEKFEDYLKTCKSHDKVLNKLKIISVNDGNCVAELTIAEEHTNAMKILHGGFSAMLVDVVTSLGLFTLDERYMVPSVSVDLHLSYQRAAKMNEEIVIESRTTKAGKTLAFLECEIKNKATGEVLVKGTQTKCFVNQKN